jgi:hypothetical protein
MSSPRCFESQLKLSPHVFSIHGSRIRVNSSNRKEFERQVGVLPRQRSEFTVVHASLVLFLRPPLLPRALDGSGARCHRFFGRPTYGFHCKGVTASGVPLPELIQPAAVRLHG